jgi:hypothetical protein
MYVYRQTLLCNLVYIINVVFFLVHVASFMYLQACCDFFFFFEGNDFKVRIFII